MKKKIFRARWMIYPKFQLLLIGINTVIVSIGFGLVWLGLRSFLSQLRQTGISSGLSPNHYYYIFLSNQASRLYWITGIAWLSSVAICAVASLLLSHKIVGPIARLRSYLQNFASGRETKPLDFRDGDFFSDLPQAVNEALVKQGESQRRAV